MNKYQKRFHREVKEFQNELNGGKGREGHSYRTVKRALKLAVKFNMRFILKNCREYQKIK